MSRPAPFNLPTFRAEVEAWPDRVIYQYYGHERPSWAVRMHLRRVAEAMLKDLDNTQAANLEKAKGPVQVDSNQLIFELTDLRNEWEVRKARAEHWIVETQAIEAY